MDVDSIQNELSLSTWFQGRRSFWPIFTNVHDDAEWCLAWVWPCLLPMRFAFILFLFISFVWLFPGTLIWLRQTFSPLPGLCDAFQWFICVNIRGSRLSHFEWVFRFFEIKLQGYNHQQIETKNMRQGTRLRWPKVTHSGSHHEKTKKEAKNCFGWNKK